MKNVLLVILMTIGSILNAQLTTDIGYRNSDNGDALEPKVTPSENKRGQTPSIFTDEDANVIIDYIKEDRTQINKTSTDLLILDNQVVKILDSIALKADRSELVDVDLKATNAQNKADANELSIDNLPPTPTKTSDLTNDGNGSEIFVTKDQLPDVSEFIKGPVYDENSGLDFKLDSTVSNFKIDFVKNGNLVSFNCNFRTSNSNLYQKFYFTFPEGFTPSRSQKGSVIFYPYFRDKGAFKAEWGITTSGIIQISVFKLMVNSTTGVPEYQAFQSSTGTSTMYVGGSFVSNN